MSRLRTVPVAWWVLGALVVAVAAWAVIGTFWLEPHLSTNADEQAYLHQGALLADGRITVDGGRAFQPWFAVPTDHGYVFKYAPVWAAVLAVGDALGEARVMLAVAAAAFALGTFALGRVLLGDRGRAVAVTAIVVCSPLVLIQGTTALSYVWFGALWTTTAAAVTWGARNRQPWALAGAGLGGGLAAWSRPYDALLLLTPFALSAAWCLLRRGEDPTPAPDAARRGRGAPACVLAPFVALGAVGLGILAYNSRATGSATRMPWSLWARNDTLGFGTRGLEPSGAGDVEFGIRQGVHGVAENLWALRWWAAGGLVLIVAAAYGCWVSRRRRELWPLAAALVTLPVGYSCFWGIANIGLLWKALPRFGPFYFLPLLVPLAVFAVEAAMALWTRRRAVVWAAGVLALAVTVVGLVMAVDVARAERDALAQPQRALDRIEDRARDGEPATVIIPGEYVGRDVVGRFSVTTGAHEPVLYRVSRGAADVAAASDPERTPYRLVGCDYDGDFPLGGYDEPSDVAPPDRLVSGHGARVERLRVRAVDGLDLSISIRVPAGATDARIELGSGDAGSASTTLPPDTEDDVAITFGPDGTLAAQLVIGLGDLRVDPGVSVGGPRIVRLTTTYPDGRTVADEWRVETTARTRGRIDVLFPGTLRTTTTVPGAAPTSVSRCRADGALEVTVR